jgi:hypothetical protein
MVLRAGDPENGGRFTVKKPLRQDLPSPVFFSQISASQLFRFPAFLAITAG